MFSMLFKPDSVYKRSSYLAVFVVLFSVLCCLFSPECVHKVSANTHKHTHTVESLPSDKIKLKKKNDCEARSAAFCYQNISE